MGRLIEAFQIFLKYGNPEYPTHCEHDVLCICGIDPGDVSPDDITRLEKLDFIISDGEDGPEFISYHFGRA